MPELASMGVVHEVESLKIDVGWAWPEIGRRFGWSPKMLGDFRVAKRPMSDGQLDYLRKVAAMVKSVPLPGGFPIDLPAEEEAPAASPPAPAGASVIHDLGREVRVMLLDDIAAKLAEEYFACVHEPNISSEEISGARFMVARMAERCGVVEELRAKIAEGKQRQQVQQSPQPSWPPAIPQQAPAMAQPRVPFE